MRFFLWLRLKPLGRVVFLIKTQLSMTIIITHQSVQSWIYWSENSPMHRDENVPSEDERMSSRLRYGMLNFSFARHNEFAFRLVLRRGIALASRHLCERPKGLLQIYRRTRRINISMKRKPNKLLVSNEDFLSWKVGGFVSDVKCLKLVVGKYFPKA